MAWLEVSTDNEIYEKWNYMSGPDLYIAALVTMMFMGGILLVIREARHQSMGKKRWGVSRSRIHR
jgi:hypothetical protein